MDRRKSIKTLLIGTAAAGALAESCHTAETKPAANAEKDSAAVESSAASANGINRMKEETEHMRELATKTFFTSDEIATITILGDIIIPRDAVSGSASDAKVPAFI